MSSAPQKCICASCQAPCKKKCSYCGEVYYCSVSCQRHHYPEHKNVCQHEVKLTDSDTKIATGFVSDLSPESLQELFDEIDDRPEKYCIVTRSGQTDDKFTFEFYGDSSETSNFTSMARTNIPDIDSKIFAIALPQNTERSIIFVIFYRIQRNGTYVAEHMFRKLFIGPKYSSFVEKLTTDSKV